MVKRIVLIILIVSIKLYAFDWPVENRVLTATLGESRGDHFYPGIELGGGEQEIFPIADGELVYFYEEGEGYSSFPRGNGSFLALQHEGRIQSVYSHLKKGSMHPENLLFHARSSTDLPEPLGLTGDTGAAIGIQLLLIIVDLADLKLLNPVKKDKPLLKPVLGVASGTSRQGPVIGKLHLKRGGIIEELTDGMTISSGEGDLVAEIYDESSFVSFYRRLAPYRIYLLKNGQSVFTIVFDALEERSDHLFPSGSKTGFDELFQDRWLFRLGTITLVEGKSQIQIKAESFSGRESSVILNIEVSSE